MDPDTVMEYTIGPTDDSAAAEVDRLNREMPVGTRVIYYPGPRSHGGRECTIRRLFGVAPYTGYIVGWVTGAVGYVLASHIETLHGEQPREGGEG